MTRARSRRACTLWLIACATLLSLDAPIGAAAFAKASAPRQDVTPPRIPPQVRAMAEAGRHVRIIVGLRARATAENVIGRSAAGELRDIRRFRTIPFFAADASPEALKRLEADPSVATIEEDAADAPSLAQSVPLVGAPPAWAAGFSASGWTVAVVDTGVDAFHPFLDGKVVSEACYSNAGGGAEGISLCPGGAPSSTAAGSASPCAGYAVCEHGTHVAGIAAGRGGAFSGVGRDATVLAIQTYTGFPAGSPTCGGSACIVAFASDQILALERVLELRDTYRIAAVNMSLGGSVKFSDTASCDAANPSRKAAIDNLRSAGIATVISSGNSGYVDGLAAPACISSAIAVGSTTKADVMSSFSNAAPFLSLLAPGESIVSSVPGGGFASLSGTSLAAPHVAGAWAVLKQRRPGASVAEIRAALRGTGLPIADERSAGSPVFPRIRIDQAIAALTTTLIALDTPTWSSVVAPSFTVAGWALDPSAAAGTGVDAVHVWAFPTVGGSPVFLGSAPYGGSRPDVGAVFGARFSDSSFHLIAPGLPPGTYHVAVYAHSTLNGAFDASAGAIVTVRPPGNPAMHIDTPVQGAALDTPFIVAGWAIDLDAVSGPGVDAIHVWAFPEAGGSPIFLGVSPYGGARPDVGAAFGGRFTQSSYQIVVNGLSPGVYTVGVYAHSAITGTFNQSAAVTLTVQR
jgi:subtilisin